MPMKRPPRPKKETFSVWLGVEVYVYRHAESISDFFGKKIYLKLYLWNKYYLRPLKRPPNTKKIEKKNYIYIYIVVYIYYI